MSRFLASWRTWLVWDLVWALSYLLYLEAHR